MPEDILAQKIAEKVLIFDGATGTEIYRRNFFVNTSYENLNLSNPAVIRSINQAYADAGAEVLVANTFGANSLKLAKFGLASKVDEINAAGIAIAREAAPEGVLVAGSIGPAGTPPAGFERNFRAADILREHIRAVCKAKPDFVLFETVSSLTQLQNVIDALDALPEEMPFMISISVDEQARTMKGEPIADVFEKLGKLRRQPSAFGLNCGIGPGAMLRAVEQFIGSCPYPLVVRPNSGMPQAVDDRTINMCSPEYFTTYAIRFLSLGVRGIGGCCGTTPDHISDMVRSVRQMLKLESPSRIHAVIKEDIPLQDPVPTKEKSSLAEKLYSGKWVHTVEIVPPQGYLLEQTLEKSVLCAQAGFDAVNIPDGPRASSRVSPLVTAYKIQQTAGIETVLHCCCRDRNLIGMQSELLGCAAMDIHNLLFITGDPPKLGDYPYASAVFDTDSIGIVKVQSRLNRGVDIGSKTIGKPTGAFILVGADPNAIDFEREIRRTREKIDAGAEAVVTQPVFDVAALLKFMKAVPELHSHKIPLIAGIWPLASYRNAEFMKNEVPGVVVPDSVMKRMAEPQDREGQRAAGIAIAGESAAAVRKEVAGIQISAPFGNVATAIAVMKTVQEPN